MKKVQVYITAKVVGTITVPDNTTDEDIKNGFVDIYFYPISWTNLEKEDLGADEYTIDILPVETNTNQIALDF